MRRWGTEGKPLAIARVGRVVLKPKPAMFQVEWDQCPRQAVIERDHVKAFLLRHHRILSCFHITFIDRRRSLLVHC